MAAFKRKTQELCDETRNQYEQRLERQEVQHERQLQTLQRQLRDVVGSCVSLTEHEQIIAAATADQRRHLENTRNHHASEMRELEQRCAQSWQAKLTALDEQHEHTKAALMQRIKQVEMLQSERSTEVKERQLSELRWSEKVEETRRAKAAVDKSLQDAEKKLQDVCHLIVSLKTRLQQRTQLARELESYRETTHDDVMKCKLAYAEMRGNMETRMAGLEKELAHLQRALNDQKANSAAFKDDIAGLRRRLRRQQCVAAELCAKEALLTEHHTAEKEQLQKDIHRLQQSLVNEQQASKDAASQANERQLRFQELQLQHQDLQTRSELQSAAESMLKKQHQHLQHKVSQYKLLVEKLTAENKKIGDEVRTRDASTEAWAKRLFGRS